MVGTCRGRGPAPGQGFGTPLMGTQPPCSRRRLVNRTSNQRMPEAKSTGHLCGPHQIEPQELIDPARWDGSDLFMMWPLPLFVFGTTRVAELVRKRKLTGVRGIPVTEMEPTDGYSPGRLSYWMPEPRARQLGEEAGIAEV